MSKVLRSSGSAMVTGFENLMPEGPKKMHLPATFFGGMQILHAFGQADLTADKSSALYG
jgi:hypothetical protein